MLALSAFLPSMIQFSFLFLPKIRGCPQDPSPRSSTVLLPLQRLFVLGHTYPPNFSGSNSRTILFDFKNVDSDSAVRS